ncbi:MAG: restriction endonuclease subunit S [Immundisolibacterales bacterium]|nr:restriction endonuclease subunit S [Immundisolibacterales bacterium]
MTRGSRETASFTATGKFRPYPAYKDSGVEWLGQIPSNWTNAPMWQISEAFSGGTPSREDPSFWGGPILWVSPKDMKQRMICDTEEKITESGLHESRLKLIEPPAILVVVRGMILAHSFPVGLSTVPLTINQDVKALKLGHGIEAGFFGWLLDGMSQQILSTTIEKAGHGTRAVRMDQWRTIRLLLPPVLEQRAIAAFLDRETAKIDALVAKKERLIELLQEKRTALITRVVTKGLDPNVPMKNSGVDWLAETPVHWNVKQLRWAITFQRGHDLPSDIREEGDVPIVSSSGISSKHSKAVAVAPGIVTGRYGTIGQFHLMNQPYWPLNTTLYSIDLHGNEPRFLRYMLMHMGPLFLLHAVKSAVPGVDRNDIHADHTALPNWTEQQEIADYLDRETGKIDALVAKVREAIERLKELRAALISAAVTGKIDVRGAAG